MATVIINENTKAGRSLIEFLKNSGYATILNQSNSVESILKGLSELQQAKEGKIEGKSARQIAEEL